MIESWILIIAEGDSRILQDIRQAFIPVKAEDQLPHFAFGSVCSMATLEISSGDEDQGFISVEPNENMEESECLCTRYEMPSR